MQPGVGANTAPDRGGEHIAGTTGAQKVGSTLVAPRAIPDRIPTERATAKTALQTCQIWAQVVANLIPMKEVATFLDAEKMGGVPMLSAYFATKTVNVELKTRSFKHVKESAQTRTQSVNHPAQRSALRRCSGVMRQTRTCAVATQPTLLRIPLSWQLGSPR